MGRGPAAIAAKSPSNGLSARHAPSRCDRRHAFVCVSVSRASITTTEISSHGLGSCLALVSAVASSISVGRRAMVTVSEVGVRGLLISRTSMGICRVSHANSFATSVGCLKAGPEIGVSRGPAAPTTSTNSLSVCRAIRGHDQGREETSRVVLYAVMPLSSICRGISGLGVAGRAGGGRRCRTVRPSGRRAALGLGGRLVVAAIAASPLVCCALPTSLASSLAATIIGVRSARTPAQSSGRPATCLTSSLCGGLCGYVSAGARCPATTRGGLHYVDGAPSYVATKALSGSHTRTYRKIIGIILDRT